jgi:hypothetical protein
MKSLAALPLPKLDAVLFCSKKVPLSVVTVVALVAALGSALAQSTYEPYEIRTIAGVAGLAGSYNGTGAPPRLFYYPAGTAADTSGNLYVADPNSHTIKRITPAAQVITLAGLQFNAGSANGTGSIARFKSPFGIAVDSAGVVYVADTYNHMIRKITPEGAVSTLAGSPGQSGSADGAGSAARFNNPFAVAVDGAGNLYVADSENHTIRKITSAGEVTTLAGSPGLVGSANGTGSVARFYRPQGIATDAHGNIYVANTGHSTIRKITPTGTVTLLAGIAGWCAGDDGIGDSASFCAPTGLVVDSGGNIYVADRDNYTIRKIAPGAVVSTVAGLARYNGSNNGVGNMARFDNPWGVAADMMGTLYVTDANNHTVRKITPAAVVSTFAGSAGFFDHPTGVAEDSLGKVYVGDTFNRTIRKITPQGVVSLWAGAVRQGGSNDGTGTEARFASPTSLASDAADNLYVADEYNHTIRKITSAGLVSTLAGLAGASGSNDGTGSSARFNRPAGVAVDSAGNVYVADRFNHTIRKITSTGIVTTLAGLAGTIGSADGTGSAARFFYPSGVAVDGAGNVYVADRQNLTVRKITADGAVTTWAGMAGMSGRSDGTGPAARFSTPTGVAVDSAGNVFVTDQFSYTLRRISPARVVTTLAGSSTSGNADGRGSAAQFVAPNGVAVTRSGDLLIADENSNTIRRGLPYTASSRKLHAGTPFDIDLPLTGPALGVECRSGGGGTGDFQVVLTCYRPVTFANASVTSGSGTVAATSGSGTANVTLSVTGASNAQTTTITLSAVNDGTSTRDLVIPLRVLLGDTNGNGSVTASDIAQVKAASGQAVTPANFRADVNANGSVNATDVSLVKSLAGSSLP